MQINVVGGRNVFDFSIKLSVNKATGGTCQGDSGGPNFIGDSLVIGGVTSYSLPANCMGVAGVFRMDREGPLTWVKRFVQANGVPPPV